MSPFDDRCVCCHGTGQIPCDSCHGEGLHQLSGGDEDDFDVCSECYGQKAISCPECGGQGVRSDHRAA